MACSRQRCLWGCGCRRISMSPPLLAWSLPQIKQAAQHQRKIDQPQPLRSYNVASYHCATWHNSKFRPVWRRTISDIGAALRQPDKSFDHLAGAGEQYGQHLDAKALELAVGVIGGSSGRPIPVNYLFALTICKGLPCILATVLLASYRARPSNHARSTTKAPSGLPLRALSAADRSMYSTASLSIRVL